MKRLQRYILRPASVLTGKQNLESLYSFKDFPVFLGCVDTPAEEDLVADMGWAIDPETGVIQLTKLIPLEILYQEQHMDGCGPTWQQYYLDLASYIGERHPREVLEIGGGQGRIATLVTERFPEVRWTIVEPNPLHLGNERITIVPAFFDDNFSYERKIDTVVFSQLLEHIYDPERFLKAIANFLEPDGQLLFGYPNLKFWLERKYTNALNFEHMMFLTDYFVDYLLAKTGFRVVNKEWYKDNHLFYHAERASASPPLPTLENKYDEYKKIFMNFIDFHLDMVDSLNKRIESARGPVYLFGAHIFSQYLIQFGLKLDKIVSILDNSPLKQGRRLYGTQLMVESPKILSGKDEAAVILKTGIYNEEIKKDILQNINDKIVFW